MVSAVWSRKVPGTKERSQSFLSSTFFFEKAISMAVPSSSPAGSTGAARVKSTCTQIMKLQRNHVLHTPTPLTLPDKLLAVVRQARKVLLGLLGRRGTQTLVVLDFPSTARPLLTPALVLGHSVK